MDIRRLRGPLLASSAYLLVLLPLLLAPIGRWHARGTYLLDFDVFPTRRLAADAAANLVLFAPLGATLHRAALRAGVTRRRRLVAVTTACALLSLSVETFQYTLDVRHSSIIDVTMNALGAFGGAVVDALLTEGRGG